jgi:serine/threonine protein kinase
VKRKCRVILSRFLVRYAPNSTCRHNLQHSGKLWLVTELLTGGDLSTRKLNEHDTKNVIEQVLRALVYLHRMGIVHRDIKLENILYENHSKNSTVRLIDFGLSRTFDRRSTASDYVRTPYTISPETAKVLLSNKDARASDEIMTDKKDVWAVGVTTFLLLSGEFPFIKSSSDLKRPEKLELLKKVSVSLILSDVVAWYSWPCN